MSNALCLHLDKGNSPIDQAQFLKQARFKQAKLPIRPENII